MSNRDEFPATAIKALQMRAAFICSNPECRCLTIASSKENETDYIYIGHASHITAASKSGPRYDPSLTSEQRKDISNAIFLCASCAAMIDKNQGADFTAEQLKTWKKNHEFWVRENLNKNTGVITEVAGTHEASGIGDVAGLRISKSAKIRPGTVARATGIGKISGTSIE
ncbi:MAG: hypothetical protein PHY02_10040 [Phycisphaerae bacterium]|nr:hypothetical protein [Phycisphaerae bacterium]